MLGSQGLVLATAMVVSSTLLFLTFSKQSFNFPGIMIPNNLLRKSHLLV
ncbi:hypothetical protein F8388_027029 [Cannabis sativa]|uniref:Uncharacterized protein n=1 Tax=Cannabis sativa TaxID=3483 RepID=A0A7J6FNR2_CANSA|nr:hypothetical protein F8388_027029 [Cannabis sativa]